MLDSCAEENSESNTQKIVRNKKRIPANFVILHLCIMIRLSVNINKFATLRNSRGGNLPDVIRAAKDCERFGAQGITVHPRPDERHIRFSDVIGLKKVVTTEFNIEGYPDERYIKL